MNEKEARAYLETHGGKGMVFGLETMRELLKRLGSPQNRLAFVQVAGTNGKGSVTAYLANILAQAGYRTGRYTSPAVFFPEEIIQIGTKEGFVPITGEQFAQGAEQLKTAMESMAQEGLPVPTMFELETALAFWFFAQQDCEIAVIETGMGGDQDATNVVENTVCSLIVSVAMDHNRILGNTLEEIASHKAGIIKPGRAAVLMAQKPEVMQMVEQICRKQGSPLYLTKPEEARVQKAWIDGQTFSYREWKRVEISLSGTFQLDNALVVLEAVEVLRNAGYILPEQAVLRGLAQTRWPGRLQVIEKDPLVLLDGAHNPDAAEKLAQTLENYFTNQQFLYIMGVLADKDYENVIARLNSSASGFVTLTPENPRALPAERLARTIRTITGKEADAAGSVKEAVQRAYEAHQSGIHVIFCGSLSFLGEAESIWKQIGKKDH